MLKRHPFWVLFVLYVCALLQFVRFYVKSTVFYLNLPAYLHGRERLPFQERILPVFFLKPLYDSEWVMRHLTHAQGAFTAELGPFYLLSLGALAVAAFYTQRLYAVLTSSGTCSFLVFPVFLYTVIWTYTIHSEANFAYPYDLPGLAFFTAGLYYLYRRQYLGLFLVVLLGTLNRETTLFLIGLYCIDSATPARTPGDKAARFDPRLVSWPRVTLLFLTWLAVKVAVAHHFKGNDASESHLRLVDNLHQLKPRLFPALLNICGYTLPLIVIFRERLVPVRFRNYLWILPVWFAVMSCSGVIVETRIYGELCSYCAVAVVLMLEQSFRLTGQNTPGTRGPARQRSSRQIQPVQAKSSPNL